MMISRDSRSIDHFSMFSTHTLYIAPVLNPLTAGAAYIRVFIFISTLIGPPFKHVNDKM